MGLFSSNDTKHTTTSSTRTNSNDHKHKKPDHVSSHKASEGKGGAGAHPTLGQKISGEMDVIKGKLTHNPHLVIEGEMKKGNDIHISSNASNPKALGGPRHK
ncbi:hypothetical protein BDY24DRAFT_413416 [Mrakia frigida]|uniref:uncharacterized protein n=1 Tax=Mrakia frigida TaxID=29902 RepID=UPI003FCC20DC